MPEIPASAGERQLSPKRVALILRYLTDEPDADGASASVAAPAGDGNGTLDAAGRDWAGAYELPGPSLRRRPFAPVVALVRVPRLLLGWAVLIVSTAVVIGLLIPHLGLSRKEAR